MPRRSSRHFGPDDAQTLLAAFGECRRACVAALTAAPIRGPVYLAVERVVDVLDDLAQELTGDRAHFHAKPHSTSGMPLPRGKP